MGVAANPKAVSRYLAVISITYAACVMVTFGNRGPILDEFWTMWMTDPHLSLTDAYVQRWSTDYHPPLYYFLVWLFRHIVNTSYVTVRLVNIFPFVMFVPALLLWKNYRGIDPWLATFLTVFASSPFFLANTVDLRSYFALTVLGACLVMLLRIGRSLPDAVLGRDKRLAGLTAATIFFSLNIHYSASLVYLVPIGAEILIALIARKWRWAVFLACTTLLSGIVLLGGLYVTLARMPAVSYMDSGAIRSLAFIGGGVLVASAVNWGIDIAILGALIRRRLGGIALWGWSLAIFCAGALALFVQSLINHAMALNYVMDLIPLGAAFIADLVAEQIFASGLLIGLVGLATVSAQAITAWHEVGNGRWLYYSTKLRAISHDCPTAQFVGVDQNALPEFADHPPVSGFIGVFGEGYATVGRFSDVTFRVTSRDHPIAVTLDPCPLVVLSDHEVKPERMAVPELLREANIHIARYRILATYQHDYQRLLVFYP